MKLSDIVHTVNELLAGERHPMSKLIRHLDRTIDDINSNLNSTYPAFSELPLGTAEYNYFPDRYLRTVVCVGAAWYYFTADEEGISTAPQYGNDYERGLFLMIRDWHSQVPEEFQQEHTSALYPTHSSEQGERGVSLNGWNILP